MSSILHSQKLSEIRHKGSATVAAVEESVLIEHMRQGQTVSPSTRTGCCGQWGASPGTPHGGQPPGGPAVKRCRVRRELDKVLLATETGADCSFVWGLSNAAASRAI